MTTIDTPAGADAGAGWTADDVRRVGHRVAEMVAAYLAALPDGPVFHPVPPELVREMRGTPAPREGTPVDALLDEWERTIAAYPFGNGHPRWYGWVNSPPAPVSVFAEALAAAMNPSVAGGNHAAVHLEHQVAGWLKEMLGFPRGAMGMFVSGGSAGALTGLAVARHVAARKLDWDVRRDGMRGFPAPLAVYAAAESHGCNQKACEILGLGSAAIRPVPLDAALRMDAAALDAMIADDAAAGRVPIAVVASAGTVNTGAIDPLDAIADVCARHGVWMHVDAAYGGPAILTERYREALAPLARADSVALDPHKWMYVPVEAGFVLVRDAAAARDAFSLVPPYLRVDGGEEGVQGPPWFSEFGVQQTRGFRALKAWMAIRHHGLDGYCRMIGHDLALADHLAGRISSQPAMELLEPRGLSVVCFRCAPAGRRGDGAALDALNRAVLAEVQLGGRAFITGTVVRGVFWLRACIINHRATEADVDAMVDAVLDAAARAGGPE
ncbi:MAG TPA: aminotransferase class V-fold PLP-dependent enzyme [Longimicrobium sp.]|nr:aminotransferase class V-fold PLP-dependent enzyme [Longimicrobium sp.]